MWLDVDADLHVTVTWASCHHGRACPHMERLTESSAVRPHLLNLYGFKDAQVCSHSNGATALIRALHFSGFIQAAVATHEPPSA